MPILFNKTVFENAKLAIWQMEEPEAYYLQKMPLSQEELDLLGKIKGMRRNEWLASRYLVHLMSNRKKRSPILKDEFGKPYIKDSDHHISFSHSHIYTAAIASRNKVGIDIQKIVTKIERIAHKFMNSNERSQLDKLMKDQRLEFMHIVWGAKESMYKSYGRKSVDFCEHMNIELSSISEGPIEFKGSLEKPDYSRKFKLFAERLEDYILVYAQEN